MILPKVTTAKNVWFPIIGFLMKLQDSVCNVKF